MPFDASKERVALANARERERDQQCPRDARCTKPAGHAGWCRTKAESKGYDPGDAFAVREVKAEPKDDDDLGQCERDPNCIRGYRHGGKGGNCSIPRDGASRRRGGGSSKAAAMQELGARREAQAAARGEKRARARIDDPEDEGGGGGGVDYEDYGLSKAERRSMRHRGGNRSYQEDDEDGEDGEDEDEGHGGAEHDGPAPNDQLERIRVPRERLERWHAEPFFESLVRAASPAARAAPPSARVARR